jgi:tetratricopeptide (TPR) repeat protein
VRKISFCVATKWLRFYSVLMLFLIRAGVALAQEKEPPELSYTQRLSQQSPDSAFSILKEMYGRSVQKKDEVTKGICLQQMGEICYYFGRYPQALDFHLQADRIFREKRKPQLIAANLNDMGILYYQNKQILLARKQYDEALSIYRETRDREGIATTYGKIGHLFEKQQRYDSAFFYQRLALIQYSLIAHKQGMAKIYENMGSIYEDCERFDSSLYYFNQSLILYGQAGEKVASIEVLNNLGDIYRKTGLYRRSIVQTGEALALAEHTNDLYEQGAAYRDLGKAYNLLQMADSAYYFLELSRRVTIDIYSKENDRQTAFLSVLFDVSKKNEEISSLENARKVNRIISAAVTIVILLLVVLGWVTISRQRLKIEKEKIIGDQNRRVYETQKELLRKELENRQLKEERLMRELDSKHKGLTSSTLHIIEKNQLLESVRNRLAAMVKDEKRDQKKQLQQLIQQINLSFNHDEYWNEFQNAFEQVHQDFFHNLKKLCEDLSGNDMRLLSLIKLNLSSTDIATLLGISPDSLRVSRYRLKKKIGLEASESLSSFVQAL